MTQTLNAHMNKIKIFLKGEFLKTGKHRVKERLNYAGFMHNLGLFKSFDSLILFSYSISARS
jgi:hypothetical protein